MKLQYSRAAIQNLENIREYISRDNPRLAWVVASFIRNSIRVLERWPYHGRATNEKDIRRLVVSNYPYAIYYRITVNIVEILAIRHTARDL
jgi:toxin ParE1/3/4